MNRDIMARKRKYNTIDSLSFDDQLDGMLESRWTVGKCLVVLAVSLIVVGILVWAGQLVIGLD